MRPPPQPTRFTRRRFMQAAGLSAAAVAAYSCEFARHHLEFVELPITLRNLPPAFHGFRIVQISDIHYDEFTEPLYFRRIVQHVNDLRADLVLITGDFITHGPPRSLPERAIYKVAAQLNALTCPQRLACMGNHDSYVGTGFIASVLRARGTPVLINQSVPVERHGQRLWIAAVEDPTTSTPDLDATLAGIPEQAPVILMAHAPDYADDVRVHPLANKVDLILSGHSHGGQVRIPHVPPLFLPAMGRKYVHGYFRFGDLQLYVNRGLGAVGLPFRLNCPPEITTITLHPA